ncbi:MAG: NYN domain-containing protein [Terracidiphilus sp.]|nr:NYN domain-containing protein [Terracidiphilus sp.]
MNEPSPLSLNSAPIGVFFDGGFTEEIRKNQDWPTDFYSILTEAVSKSAALLLGVGRCHAVASQWFRGLLTMEQVSQKYYYRKAEQMTFYERERCLAEQLLNAGVEAFRLPMRNNGPSPREKGIDSLLFAKAIQCIEHERPAALVLIAGDGDHVSLLREAARRGTRTISVWYEGGDAKSASQLKECATWSLQVSLDPDLHLVQTFPASTASARARAVRISPTEASPVPGRPNPL